MNETEISIDAEGNFVLNSEVITSEECTSKLKVPVRTIDSVASLEKCPIAPGDIVAFETANNTFLYKVGKNELIPEVKDQCVVKALRLNYERLSRKVYGHSYRTESSSFPYSRGPQSDLHKMVYTLLVIAHARKNNKALKDIRIGTSSPQNLEVYITKFKKGDKLKIVTLPEDTEWVLSIPRRSDVNGKYFIANTHESNGDLVITYNDLAIPDSWLTIVTEAEWQERDKKEFEAFIRGFLPRAIERNESEARDMMRNKLQSCFQILRRARLQYWAAINQSSTTDFDKVANDIVDQMNELKKHEFVESVVFNDDSFVIKTKNIIINDISYNDEEIRNNRDFWLKEENIDVFNAGKWKIIIDLKNGRSKAKLIEPSSPSQERSRYKHPHISAGNDWNNYCLGTLSSQYAAAISDFKILTIFNCIFSLLRNYNKKSPYKGLFEIHGLTSSSVGTYNEDEEDDEQDESDMPF